MRDSPIYLNSSLADDIRYELVNLALNDERIMFGGLVERDLLRLEAGLCLYGHELDKDKTPVEANLKWAISKARVLKGNFIGSDKINKQLNWYSKYKIEDASKYISYKIEDTSKYITYKVKYPSKYICYKIENTSKYICYKVEDTSKHISYKVKDTNKYICNKIEDISKKIYY